MNDEAQLTDEWLLSTDVVREAIEVLQRLPIHPQFVLYLQLRKRANDLNRFDGLVLDYDVIKDWLVVPGGPPDKPHYRPFSNSRKPNTSAFWMNPNLQGSYARSSLRPEVAALFLDAKRAFRLPVDATGAPDPNPIAQTLLASSRIPAWALAAFLFRNYAFWAGPDAAQPGASELLYCFEKYFGWTARADGGLGEDILFDWDARPTSPVFELASVAEGRVFSAAVENIILDDGRLARQLDADALGIGYVEAPDRATAAPDSARIDSNDPALVELIHVVEHYGGAILSGPPGTSKSHLASAAARVLADFDPSRYRFTQFHQSYQFDDFIEGYRPREDSEDRVGGFELRDGTFIDFCERARRAPDKPHAFVIDELSRGDVGRIFGEALTYIERSRRNLTFTLPSGREFSIPPNVYIIATMNPLDRGVDEVDAAFERRFAKLTMNPDVNLLEQRLADNGVSEALRGGVLRWFNSVNGQALTSPAAAVGHAYFWDVTGEESLRELWRYQLVHLVERAFRHDPSLAERYKDEWEGLFENADELGTAEEPDTPGGIAEPTDE